ncbi:MAG: adenylate/guanylate cyclase domain-containing protein [Methylophilaceae bacterium]
MSAIERNEAEIFEAAILFTDIRGSSKLIKETPPRDYFHWLNQSLSAQADHIQKYEGCVIKYTGDGMMAIFRGMGKSYLSLRCALELASTSNNHKLPFGIGVAEGLVLAGFIGDFQHTGQRQQYDVIGANVHLAARLCAMADAGSVVTTKEVNHNARLDAPTPQSIGSVAIKGFNTEVDCVAFNAVH